MVFPTVIASDAVCYMRVICTVMKVIKSDLVRKRCIFKYIKYKKRNIQYRWSVYETKSAFESCQLILQVRISRKPHSQNK